MKGGWKQAYLLELLPEPLLPELPEPEELLPGAVSVLEPGVVVLEGLGLSKGGKPEDSLPEEPELPLEVLVLGEVLEAAPELPEDPVAGSEEPLLIEPVELPELPDSEVLDGSELPLLDETPSIPEEPEEPDEPLLDGSFVVVVVVVVVEPPVDPLDALLGNSIEEASFEASVVVVVVVCCAKLALAIPIRAKKVTKGNFFMIDPCHKYLESFEIQKSNSYLDISFT